MDTPKTYTCRDYMDHVQKVAQELEIDNDQELSVLLAAWASK